MDHKDRPRVVFERASALTSFLFLAMANVIWEVNGRGRTDDTHAEHLLFMHHPFWIRKQGGSPTSDLPSLIEVDRARTGTIFSTFSVGPRRSPVPRAHPFGPRPAK